MYIFYKWKHWIGFSSVPNHDYYYTKCCKESLMGTNEQNKTTLKVWQQLETQDNASR